MAALRCRESLKALARGLGSGGETPPLHTGRGPESRRGTVQAPESSTPAEQRVECNFHPSVLAKEPSLALVAL